MGSRPARICFLFHEFRRHGPPKLGAKTRAGFRNPIFPRIWGRINCEFGEFFFLFLGGGAPQPALSEVKPVTGPAPGIGFLQCTVATFCNFLLGILFRKKKKAGPRFFPGGAGRKAGGDAHIRGVFIFNFNKGAFSRRGARGGAHWGNRNPIWPRKTKDETDKPKKKRFWGGAAVRAQFNRQQKQLNQKKKTWGELIPLSGHGRTKGGGQVGCGYFFITGLCLCRFSFGAFL